LTAAESAKLPANYEREGTTGKTELSPSYNEITEFVSNKEDTVQVVLRQLSQAREEILGIGSRDSPNVILKFRPYREAVTEAVGRIKLPPRYITDVIESNLEACKFLINDLHVKVRHLKDVRSTLTITENEFTSDLSSPHPDRSISKLLYSNSKELLIQQKQLFETLWSIAIPAEQRIKEIEEGAEPEETRLLTQTPDSREVSDVVTRISLSTRSEALILLPTLERLELNNEVFQILERKAQRESVRVRILAPLPSDLEIGQRIIKQFSMFEIRQYEPIHIGLIISDNRRMIFIQYLDIQNKDLDKAIVSGIYSTHKETISSIVSIYETMWASSKVREKEAKSRKQAELLQDILTHDIRNYNQVARLSAELLKEELKDNLPVQSIVESMLRAVDGSTHLLERAKKLGRVLSDENPSLYSVDLKEVIRTSLDLIKMSYPDKAITCVERYPKDIMSIYARVDDLVGEVFTNVLSNSVVYTTGESVRIEIDVRESEHGNLSMMETAGPSSTVRPYWIVSISDYGKGIPDEIKPKLFSRYLESAKGSGLGMSIVHALVVERYKGTIHVVNRVLGDYTKGTTVEIWLPKT
jgi:signal transduction histidine kinase